MERVGVEHKQKNDERHEEVCQKEGLDLTHSAEWKEEGLSDHSWTIQAVPKI